MQNLKHTAENSVADKFADLSDAMGEFVQSILLTASLFFNADSPTGILSAYFWMFSLNTVLGTPTTQIISLVIATFFFSAVYAPLPTPGALGVPRPRKFNVQKHIVPFIIGSLTFHMMHHQKVLFFRVSLMSFFDLTIICVILLWLLCISKLQKRAPPSLSAHGHAHIISLLFIFFDLNCFRPCPVGRGPSLSRSSSRTSS